MYYLMYYYEKTQTRQESVWWKKRLNFLKVHLWNNFKKYTCPVSILYIPNKIWFWKGIWYWKYYFINYTHDFWIFIIHNSTGNFFKTWEFHLVIQSKTLFVTKTPYFLDFSRLFLNPIFGLYNPFYPDLTQIRVLFFWPMTHQMTHQSSYGYRTSSNSIWKFVNEHHKRM